MNFSLVQVQNKKYLKFGDEKQTFDKVQGLKQYFTQKITEEFLFNNTLVINECEKKITVIYNSITNEGTIKKV